MTKYNSQTHSPHAFFLLMAGVFTALLFTTVRLAFPNLALWQDYLIAINVTAFLMIVLDKSTAQSSWFARNRIPERIFFILAAIGGAIGMFLAMHVVRHKTQKASFQLVVAGIFLLQLVVWGLALRQ